MPKGIPNTPRAATTDERLVRGTSPEVRGDRGIAEDAERIDSELISDDDFEKIIASEFEQTALPSPPAIPGWHLCWLTTTSQYDSIQKRQRLGYIPVRRDEMKNFDPSNGQKLANYESAITCNEMVLFKIEEGRFQAIMKYFHHRKPMEEEAGVLSSLKAHAGQKDSKGRAVATTEGDGAENGIEELERSVERAAKVQPTFS